MYTKFITKFNVGTFVILLTVASSAIAQERIFSIGYGKALINNDSSTYTISIDLNRVPGSNEKGNGYFFVNERIDSTRWGYYAKPTADINLGSGTSAAPNNVSVGLAFGLAYDFKESKIGIASFCLEMSPDFVGDKTLRNSLKYLSLTPCFQVDNTWDGISIFLGAGFSYSLGKRSILDELDHAYSRTSVPVSMKLRAFNFAEGEKMRLHLSATYKFNKVFNDIEVNERSFDFFNVKTDFYLLKNLAVNFTYNCGFEEPLFKENNAFSFGVTLAR
ncbi:hypothetical protein [Pseudochryseolinea flava]|uniref:Outer membrane protein beta-barrel domain-containing protein n=1 Tax=Pseudochryseolinea flava TaxID=2059302 RepID=A0A364XX69_9BACT|nr:hypothetical protein [Pseudochryseolinea flava]RAV98881.1 hypothetical protein DQQ10_21505 [Pseudochryseolinea flava]